VLCLIVVSLPPGENPFAVKINNNNKNTSFSTIQPQEKNYTNATLV
jgi:hypothetical protein